MKEVTYFRTLCDFSGTWNLYSFSFVFLEDPILYFIA